MCTSGKSDRRPPSPAEISISLASGILSANPHMISLSLSTSSVPSSFSEIGRRRSAASGCSIGGVLNIENLDDLVDDPAHDPSIIYHMAT